MCNLFLCKRKTKQNLVGCTVQQTEDAMTLKQGKWQTVLQIKHTFALRGLKAKEEHSTP
jgi:hypothetical protein